MAEKRKSGYEIGEDFKALWSLIDEFNELERELTEEDDKRIKEEIDKIINEEIINSYSDFKDKLNNCCKLVKNCEIEADIAIAEKDSLKEQSERLMKRANARLNIAKRVKNGTVSYLMDLLISKGLLEKNKFKSELFTVYYRNNQKSVQEVKGFFNPDQIPNEFLKRKINPTAIKNAIEEGRLFTKSDEEVEKNPLLKGKLFFKDGRELKGVSYTGGQSLVIS